MNLIKRLKDFFSNNDDKPIGLKQIKRNNKIYQTKGISSLNKKEKLKISDLIKGEIY
jgi:hypothetical protein